MAATGPLEELCEEATCSICLDYFRDPVTIAGCGHTFCRACLTHSWGKPAEASCPLCRGPAHEGTLRPNHQLANIAEIIQKLRPVGGKGGICEKHQEPLKLFCREDEAPLCLVCGRSQVHRDHQVIPLEEASQGNRDEFCYCLDNLKKERVKILACKVDVVKESRDLLKQTTEQKQDTVAKFRELHTFLEEQEKLLLAEMEEVEKEVAKNREQRLVELSKAFSSVDNLIQDMEEKCQQPAIELLQGARSILQRYEEMEVFKNPLPFPFALKWQIWDLSNLNPLWEHFKKQFKDTMDSGLHSQKANVTLDPDTAHPLLNLSEDRKTVRQGTFQALPDNPERFDCYCAVLGREGFTGGRHFWEVLVGSEGEWAVGVARKSVRRKGEVIFSPEEGIWEVGKWGGGDYWAAIKGSEVPLFLSEEPKRIRICLNYDGGQVAFFDADRGVLIYEFSGASFSGETLLPFFYVYGKATLKLSSEDFLFTPGASIRKYSFSEAPPFSPSLERPSCPSFGYLEKATSNSLLPIFSSHQQHQLENIVSQEFLPLKSPVKASPGFQPPRLTGVKWRHFPNILQHSPFS